MNQNLQKQLKVYIGVATAMLATDRVKGQIVYVDVNPDTIVDASPANSGIHNFLLDMDNDGTNDLSFNVKLDSSGLWNFQFIRVTPLDSMELMDSSSLITASIPFRFFFRGREDNRCSGFGSREM